MNKQEKKDLATKLKNLINQKSFGIVLSHKKITFEELDKVRRMAQKDTKIIKIKNKIAQKTLSGSIYEPLTHKLKNENFFIFGNDCFETCKLAKELSQNVTEVSIIKASSEDNPEHSIQFITDLAKLGSKENLQSSLLSVINEVVRQPLGIIDAKQQKMQDEAKS